jgi:hypothetical protein
MIDEQPNSRKLLDTTDCLEAVGVFRGWKNFLFVVILAALVLQQGVFWLVDRGVVKTSVASDAEQVRIAEPNEPNLPAEIDNNTLTVAYVAAESNVPVTDDESEKKGRPKFNFKIEVGFAQAASIIRFLNFVLIPASILYCLTLMFALKLSLVGRLGGINHVARAFFIALVFVVLLLPWQKYFPGIFKGALYLPGELLEAKTNLAADIFSKAWYYLKFTGYWLFVVILLVFAQIRSFDWAKAILKRLEVI